MVTCAGTQQPLNSEYIVTLSFSLVNVLVISIVGVIAGLLFVACCCCCCALLGVALARFVQLYITAALCVYVTAGALIGPEDIQLHTSAWMLCENICMDCMVIMTIHD